ncbi:MAG: NAD(P)H-hydrate dehydratase [Chitinophagaceae bacterium]|nr:NAD(P)H-hydrate dehydratase [Chitinophagaceae bacterium]
MKIFSAPQIKEWDQFTITHEPTSSLDLMERAAEKCTEWVVQNKPSEHYKIFCGKGNNGGDGLVIARMLADQQKEVDVFILEFGKSGTDDFQENLRRLHNTRAIIHFIQNETVFPDLKNDDVVVECLYGAGLNRPLDGLSAQLVQHINPSKAAIIAIDVPAGMFVDSSSVSNTIIQASCTLTFQSTKLCFLVPENEQFTGDVVVLDIGLHKNFDPKSVVPFQLVDAALAGKIYKPRKQFSHKGSFGHALIIGGSKGKMGAALLASKACLRSGTGLVTASVPEWGLPVIQSAVCETMAITFEDLDIEKWDRYQSVGIGPGLGTEPDASDLLKKCMASFKKPLVIDADGLNILSKNPKLFELLTAGSILTPHPKEFERLFGPAENDFVRIDLALQKAAAHQIIIVLKGHHTFIACPAGNGYFNSTGNAGMATGGSGDVLTGIITGLLAQGYQPEDAAIFGVYLHGLAGDIAAGEMSQEALIAGDLVQFLGEAYLAVSNPVFQNQNVSNI